MLKNFKFVSTLNGHICFRNIPSCRALQPNGSWFLQFNLFPYPIPLLFSTPPSKTWVFSTYIPNEESSVIWVLSLKFLVFETSKVQRHQCCPASLVPRSFYFRKEEKAVCRWH
ncbi:hypothetical protein GDO78_008784 [Eleutherodactylus coqui]|uniref:Uncharacterized protein n=1 Tax=Eleutherodactylus coqui TaxID=57060 RepID=A0A8J6KB77_ELECQ|nr:hypothetical protein GDO78_008784 [Eleutherodactylus coqui]